jgi:DNA invertase Pin-like site-specific DNA recombinase
MSTADSTAPDLNDTVSLYRISDDKQESLPSQQAWARRVAHRDALNVVAEFEDEGISGAAATRPGLEALASFVKERFFARQPVRYLLCLDLDRFLRRDSISTGGWLDKLRTHGLRYIITTAQRFDLYSQLDRTFIALGSDFTREPELRSKSNHVLNRMAELAREGLWMGGPVPPGYRAVADPSRPPSRSGKPALRLALGPPEEVELVRWIFRTYAGGLLTAAGIARKLNAQGATAGARRAGRWSAQTVLKIIHSRVYLGWVVWGQEQVGRYHSLKAGIVAPREDKEDREQQQLLRGLKHLPGRIAGDQDCVIKKGAHEAIIGPELFDLCQRQVGRNRINRSAPRGDRVWPLAGQLVCGHCGKPVWVVPTTRRGGKRGNAAELSAVSCSTRQRGQGLCPAAGTARHAEVLDRVVTLVQGKLAGPGAAEEMAAAYERLTAEQAQAGQGERQRLQALAAELEGKIAQAVARLASVPADLQADVAEHVRGLKRQRDETGQALRELDRNGRAAQAPTAAEFRATLETARGLSRNIKTREEAEALRAALRELVAEVRLFFRPREAAEKLARGQGKRRKMLARLEIDLTPALSDLMQGVVTIGKPLVTSLITIALDL